MDDFVRCINDAHRSKILADDYKYRVMQHCVTNYFEPSIYNMSSDTFVPWLENLEYSTRYPHRFNNFRFRRHQVIPYAGRYSSGFYDGYRRGFRRAKKDKINKK